MAVTAVPAVIAVPAVTARNSYLLARNLRSPNRCSCVNNSAALKRGCSVVAPVPVIAVIAAGMAG